MLIYALTDPSGEVRYIGKTGKRLIDRLRGHIKDARQGFHNHKCWWIRSLLRHGQRPAIIQLAECDGDGCAEEIQHIADAIASGTRLTNATAGGEGSNGASPETREKQRRAKLGRRLSEATKQKVSATLLAAYASGERAPMSEECRVMHSAKLKAIVHTPEFRAKMSAGGKGKKLSAEHKAKVAASIKGKTHPPGWSEKMSAAMKGRIFSDETKEKMRQAKLAAHNLALATGTKNHSAKFSPAEERAICDEYRAGGRTKIMAGRLNVRRDLISSILRRHGVEIRPHTLLPEQVEKMRASIARRRTQVSPVASDPTLFPPA